MSGRRVRARSVFLWGLAGVCALQLGMRLAVDSALGRYRDLPYAHMMARLRPRWHARRTGGPEAPQRLLVVLGSSRTGNDVRGERVEAELAAALGERWAVSNLAVPGAGPLVELVNGRRLFAEGVRPDLLLVEVVPILLTGSAAETTWIRADRMARSEIELLGQCGLPEAAALRRAWWQDWACPWYAHRFALLSDVVPNFVPMPLQQNWAAPSDRTGWVSLPNGAPTAEQRRAGHEQMRRWHEANLRDARLTAWGQAAQREILAQCRRHDVPAALVLLPESDALRAWYGPATRARLDAFLAELRDRYGVPVIDARAWAGDDDFGDDVHLHAAGADVFSRRLGRALGARLRRSTPSPAPPAGTVPVGTTRPGQ